MNARHLSAQVEEWRIFREEVKPLLPLHWEELALDKEQVKLSPRWDVYDQMAANGQLSIVSIRAAGQLVGYSITMVTPGLHYSECLDARMDIFWLHPEHRGKGGGVRLFAAVESELRRRGVQRWYAGSKLHKDTSRLFLALGFTPIETWFSKWLGD